jgi:cob(I)alamin adenosyltransferase
MSIYTRTGDQGETDLLDGVRASKDAALLEVCGTLDEFNALLGLARCESLPEGAQTLLEQLQRRLFDVGADLMAIQRGQAGVAVIGSPDVTAIEQAIDRYDANLESLGTFILPAGIRGSAALHLARAVCRRAERRLVSLSRTRPQAVAPGLLAYMNRLSDLLYVLARAANAHAGVADTQC